MNNKNNGYRYQIDIPYTDELKGDLIIEATFWIEERKDNPDSDWESRDWYELEGFCAYKNGEPVYVDIPYDVLYTGLFDKFREISIEYEMNDNEGF